jgi:hypothetical protein
MRDEVFWRINGNDNLLQLLFNNSSAEKQYADYEDENLSH